MPTPDLKIRIATSDDHEALRLALAYAIDWRAPRPEATTEEVIVGTGHEYLLDGWGRKGDAAVVAEVGLRTVGAAWYRFWDETEHSYGYVDPDTPELGVGVHSSVRGHGVGTALLSALLGLAFERGVTRLSLSVESDNPAVSLYDRLGFVRVRRVDASWTMVKDLR